jgi:hypothetical protein
MNRVGTVDVDQERGWSGRNCEGGLLVVERVFAGAGGIRIRMLNISKGTGFVKPESGPAGSQTIAQTRSRHPFEKMAVTGLRRSGPVKTTPAITIFAQPDFFSPDDFRSERNRNFLHVFNLLYIPAHTMAIYRYMQTGLVGPLKLHPGAQAHCRLSFCNNVEFSGLSFYSPAGYVTRPKNAQRSPATVRTRRRRI